jgi:hypothetical protein
MRVAEKRWGEISIKQQGDRKNQFDKTRSFSLIQTDSHYDIDQLKVLLELLIALTEDYSAVELTQKLRRMKHKDGQEG